MYTDDQLALMKSGLESGTPLPRVLKENGIERTGNPRQALFEKYGRETIQEIIRTKVRPNLQAQGGAGGGAQRIIGQLVNRLVQRPQMSTEQLDAVIAAFEDGIVQLNMRKQELGG